jgi:hypothetical protein
LPIKFGWFAPAKDIYLFLFESLIDLRMQKSENNHSRRNFLKSASSTAIAITGIQTIGYSTSYPQMKDRNINELYNGKQVTLKDRIERVKIATLGMQRYDW